MTEDEQLEDGLARLDPLLAIELEVRAALMKKMADHTYDLKTITETISEVLDRRSGIPLRVRVEPVETGGTMVHLTLALK